ncbi:MAG: hypothetical protein HYS27_13425 [Deltaproteobacteria bacterium]|nr:hypothetical protein [Deltaproteobacteria bacterium]
MITIAALLALALPLGEDPAFAEGRRLYEESEYEQAIFRLQEAALVADREPTDRATVFLWLGLAYAGFGDVAAARRAFGDALRLEPTLAPPVEISPKVADEIEAVRSEVAAERAVLRAPATGPPTPTPDAPGDEHPWGLVAGLAGMGAVSVVAGGVAVGFAMQNHGIVNDLETFQDDAARAQDERDAQVIVAVVLFGAGTALLGGGGAVLVADLLAGDVAGD